MPIHMCARTHMCTRMFTSMCAHIVHCRRRPPLHHHPHIETDSDPDNAYTAHPAPTRTTLISSEITPTQAFVVDVQQFRSNFEQHGPMVPGLEPIDAAERLKKCQLWFHELEHKWSTYADGEELFGLPVTKYPELVQSKKELELLDRLYSLYLMVPARVCTRMSTRTRTHARMQAAHTDAHAHR